MDWTKEETGIVVEIRSLHRTLHIKSKCKRSQDFSILKKEIITVCCPFLVQPSVINCLSQFIESQANGNIHDILAE